MTTPNELLTQVRLLAQNPTREGFEKIVKAKDSYLAGRKIRDLPAKDADPMNQVLFRLGFIHNVLAKKQTAPSEISQDANFQRLGRRRPQSEGLPLQAPAPSHVEPIIEEPQAVEPQPLSVAVTAAPSSVKSSPNLMQRIWAVVCRMIQAIINFIGKLLGCSAKPVSPPAKENPSSDLNQSEIRV